MARDREQLDNSLETLQPVWNDNYVAIAMSSSDAYLPYLSVCLQSLVEHTSTNHNYDIIIFSSGKNEYFKQLIINSYSAPNISVRFFNPQKILANVKLSITHSYFNEACYYRITAPIVMNNYKKVIFTDIDLIFNSDIKDLYEMEIGEYVLAACKEPIWELYIANNTTIMEYNIREYSNKNLQLQDINTYYNTGVVLINIPAYIENDYFSKLCSEINTNIFLYQEQDALNKVLNKNIYSLDRSWNFEISPRLNNQNEFYDAKIIHYLGGQKPWVYPENMHSWLWWQYARRTPYYEVILQRMINSNNTQLRRLTNQVRETFNFRSNVLKYWRYKLMAKISFGKKKEHYNTKKQQWKEKIRIAKQLRGKN